MSPTPEEKLRQLTDLAVAMGYITFAQADECLRGASPDMLVSRGWITPKQLQEMQTELKYWQGSPGSEPSAASSPLVEVVDRPAPAPAPVPEPAAPPKAADPGLRPQKVTTRRGLPPPPNIVPPPLPPSPGVRIGETPNAPARPPERDEFLEQLIERRRRETTAIQPAPAAAPEPKYSMSDIDFHIKAPKSVVNAFGWLRRHALKIGIAVVVIGGVSGTLWTLARRSAKAEEFLAAAKKMEALGNLEEARDAYREANDYSSSDEAKAGFERTDAEVKRREAAGAEAAAREKTRVEMAALLESGRLALDRALRMLEFPGTAFKELTAQAEEAQQLIEKSMARAPDKPHGHLLLGRSWALRADDDKAEDCWRKAIEIDSKFAPAHFELGRLQLARHWMASAIGGGRVSDATVKEAERELEAAAYDEDELHRRFASIALEYLRGRLESAHYKAIAATDHMAAQDGVEDLYWLAGVTAPSAERRLLAFDQAISRQALHAPARLGRGAARESAGNLAGAIDDYSKALQIRPKMVNGLFVRGRARLAKGDAKGASADLEKALEMASAGWTNRDKAKGLLDKAKSLLDKARRPK